MSLSFTVPTFFSPPRTRNAAVLYPVSSRKILELERKMARLGLRPEDFEERFARSSGAGGQHVNKVSTCVVLRHLPTGLEVRCQRERSQALNRFLAKRLLTEKIERYYLGRESERQKAFEKIRRQKRKRSKRAKEKMLEGKRLHAAKKSLRRKVNSSD